MTALMPVLEQMTIRLHHHQRRQAPLKVKMKPSRAQAQPRTRF